MSPALLLRPAASALVVGALCLLVFQWPLVAVGQAIDPQTLVGEWAGQFRTLAGSGGKYYLTIEKVEGDKVQLRIERPDLEFPLPRDVRATGRLEGNRLLYAPPRVPRTELTIDGNRMYGTSQGRDTLTIELQKTK